MYLLDKGLSGSEIFDRVESSLGLIEEKLIERRSSSSDPLC